MCSDTPRCSTLGPGPFIRATSASPRIIAGVSGFVTLIPFAASHAINPVAALEASRGYVDSTSASS
jgi:hypothetical protein